MHELSRLAYLQALGTESYVSRAQMPGAAPTRRLVVVRGPANAPVPEQRGKTAGGPTDRGPTDHGPTDRGPTAGPLTELAGELSLSGAQGKVAPGPSPVVVPSSEQQAQTQPAPRFSLAAIVVGGWLWLEELSESVLAREQVQLVQAMARALATLDVGQAQPEAAAEPPEVTQFNWPIHTNRQLDCGPEAARSSVAGFIHRKLEERGCRGLVLLGEDCATRVPLEQFREGRLCCTASTADMLLDAQLKRQVWLDLLALTSQQ